MSTRFYSDTTADAGPRQTKNTRKRNILGDISNKNGAGAAATGAIKKVTSKMQSVGLSHKGASATQAAADTASAAAAPATKPSRPEGEARQKRASFGRAGQNIATVRDIDEVNAGNPQYATAYINDMHAHFRNEEGRCAISATYMKSQTDINEKMRAILIDWLIEVHLKFKLKLETLYLTINVIDRFLERTLVSRQKLQLVGVTALLLSSKYEEIYPPEIRELVYITDKAYTRSQVRLSPSLPLCGVCGPSPPSTHPSSSHPPRGTRMPHRAASRRTRAALQHAAARSVAAPRKKYASARRDPPATTT